MIGFDPCFRSLSMGSYISQLLIRFHDGTKALPPSGISLQLFLQSTYGKKDFLSKSIDRCRSSSAARHIFFNKSFSSSNRNHSIKETSFFCKTNKNIFIFHLDVLKLVAVHVVALKFFWQTRNWLFLNSGFYGIYHGKFSRYFLLNVDVSSWVFLQ